MEGSVPSRSILSRPESEGMHYRALPMIESWPRVDPGDSGRDGMVADRRVALEFANSLAFRPRPSSSSSNRLVQSPWSRYGRG